MAGSIKGILVEIGGDTSGLQKALKKVNSETSGLSKELKGINSLLKLDPKNTELLAQKIPY
jgi:phage-related minor tail protein